MTIGAEREVFGVGMMAPSFRIRPINPASGQTPQIGLCNMLHMNVGGRSYGSAYC